MNAIFKEQNYLLSIDFWMNTSNMECTEDAIAILYNSVNVCVHVDLAVRFKFNILMLIGNFLFRHYDFEQILAKQWHNAIIIIAVPLTVNNHYWIVAQPCVHMTWLDVGIFTAYQHNRGDKASQSWLWFSITFALPSSYGLQLISNFCVVILCHVADRQWHFQQLSASHNNVHVMIQSGIFIKCTQQMSYKVAYMDLL